MKIILGSQSPRRQELLAGLGFNFEVIIADTDESYPTELTTEQIAPFIAKAKVDALLPKIRKTDLLICADTIVVLGEKILGKPKDKVEAKKMLQDLSGKTHTVITAYCVFLGGTYYADSVSTAVTFTKISNADISHYLEIGQPYDKAGGYGIQDWIGFIGVDKIDGSYTNVMGLPTSKIYALLKKLGA